MTEENKSPVDGVAEDAITEQQPQELSYSQTEQDALAAGWVPEEEFNGDKTKWVSADEYLRRGELFKKIEFQSRELKDVKRALMEMKKLHTSVREVEYQRALDTLRAQKKNALLEGDADAVVAADERIALVREEQKQAQTETQDFVDTPEEHPHFVEWRSKNNWYVSNAPMRAFADALGMELSAKGMAPDDVLKQVEKEVRSEFPNKFRNANQNRPSSVESASNKGSSSKTFALTAEENRVMKTLVKQGVMSEADYIRDIKAIRGN